MTHTSKPKPKKARIQQSMWLMLGSAMLLSLGGFAVIAQHSMPAATGTIDASALQVVELPTAVTQSASASTDRPSVAQAPSTNTLRRVTRPVMRSHSSN